MATQEFRRKLNLYIWKLNLSGIAAAYCDRMSMAKQAVELRENMARLEAEMSAFLEDLKRRGESPYVDDWIRPKDDILWFDRCELAKVSREEGARVLGTFVAGVKAGSRARVVVKRGGDTAEFNILFDERPKDLLAISQVASIIPSGGNGGGTEVVPVQKTEKNFFADPKEWGKESARRQVLDEWRVVNSEFARGLVLFLEVPDVEVDDALRAVLAKHFEKFNPYNVRGVDEHASAAKSLFEAMKPLKSKRAAESVALGHLGEACRDGVTPGKAAAEAGGLSLSTDRRVWGSGEDLLLYNLLVAPADAERAAGSGSFRMSYLGTYLMLKKTLEAGKGYRTLHALLLATAKKGDDRAKRHLEALADEVRMAAKCGACTNGKVDCPECGGKGSVSVSKCATCGGTGREGGAGSSFNITCRTCKDKEPLKSGGLKDCPKCTKFDHRVKCPACKGEEWLSSLQAAPRIMTTSLCRPCAGSGHVFRRVARVCERCAGVGVIVAPASKPRALLRD